MMVPIVTSQLVATPVEPTVRPAAWMAAAAWAGVSPVTSGTGIVRGLAHTSRLIAVPNGTAVLDAGAVDTTRPGLMPLQLVVVV
jgi:hypothetical protein